MKRVFLIISLGLAIQSSFCQNQLGVKIGYNWFDILKSNNGSNHTSSFTPDYNSIPVTIFFCQRNHLINCYAELEFINRSYSVSEFWNGFRFADYASYKIRSYFVNITIAPQFVFGKKIKFITYPGLYVGVPIYSSIDGTLTKTSYYHGPSSETITGNAKDWIPKIDFGALVGIGIDIPISKNIIITIQDILSISITTFTSKCGVEEYPAMEKQEKYRFFENKFEFGIAYQFNTKKKIENK